MYLPVPFFLDEALQICELCLQSQCPCCNECAARKVLSISSVTSCFVNVFSRLKADTFLSCSHVVTCKVEDIFRHSVMLGYIVWSISFKIADAVIGTVLGSCCSHFFCHKVILASRSKGEGNESLWNVENWPKEVIHVSFDATSIDGTANRHCTAVSWSPLPNPFSSSLIRWPTKGIVRFLL